MAVGVEQALVHGLQPVRLGQLQHPETADRRDGHLGPVRREGLHGRRVQPTRIFGEADQVDRHQPAQGLQPQQPRGLADRGQVGLGARARGAARSHIAVHGGEGQGGLDGQGQAVGQVVRLGQRLGLDDVGLVARHVALPPVRATEGRQLRLDGRRRLEQAGRAWRRRSHEPQGGGLAAAGLRRDLHGQPLAFAGDLRQAAQPERTEGFAEIDPRQAHALGDRDHPGGVDGAQPRRGVVLAGDEQTLGPAVQQHHGADLAGRPVEQRAALPAHGSQPRPCSRFRVS